jgi:hypothetical protein
LARLAAVIGIMRHVTETDGIAGGSMGRSGRIGRIATATSVALAGIALAAPPADAVFHLMKVREVYPGSSANPQAEFVELQMYAAGQNLVGGHVVRTYDNFGNPSGVYTFPTDVANGENQRSILIASASGAAQFGIVPDHQVPDDNDLYPDAGAVCFEDLDCVAWGSFPGGPLSSPFGSPASAIPDGASLERSIAPNCVTLLEGADDTDNSAADFFAVAPSPRNNATPPTETPCTGGGNPGGGPNTTITKGPKKKTRKKKATFEFSSPTPGVSFECSVDGNAPKAFGTCTSPFTVRVKKGKHTFEVRAVLDGVADGSPAQQKWKVKKRKKRK